MGATSDTFLEIYLTEEGRPSSVVSVRRIDLREHGRKL
jgi:hypothetical protein